MKKLLQNFGLILFGLFLGLVLIEGLMRGAGFIYSYLQERENLASLRKQGGYTIICVGESTTVLGNFPRRLEEILNEWAGAGLFSVVNKGINSTNSRILADQIGDNIERYRPSVVIAMMGINDIQEDSMAYAEVVASAKIAAPAEVVNGGRSGEGPFYAGLKTFKLFQAILEHVRTPRQRVDPEEAGKRETSARVVEEGYDIPVTLEGALYCMEHDIFGRGTYVCEQLLARDPSNPEIRHLLANFYREIGRPEDSEKLYLALLAEAQFLPLDRYRITLDYARVLKDGKRLPEALEAFKAAVILNPGDSGQNREIVDFFFRNDFIREFGILFRQIPLSADELVKLAETVMRQKRYDEGTEFCRRALELDPGNRLARLRLAFFLNMAGGSGEVPELCRGALAGDLMDSAAYAELGHHHYLRGEQVPARRFFSKAMSVNPEISKFDVGLGIHYTRQGWHEQARAVFHRALLVQPFDVRSYVRLAQTFLATGELEQAQKVTNEALALFPENEKALGLKGVVLEKMGRREEAEEFFLQAELLREGRFSRMTVENYRRLRSILGGKGIPLVAVQYPLRGVAPLKLMLPDHEGVIFVDNEKIFREAVKRDGYEEYFTDFFAGDFGHFTPRGAELLAENIARTMKEAGLFDKLPLPRYNR